RKPIPALVSLPSVALSSVMVKQFHHIMGYEIFLPLRIKLSLTWGTLQSVPVRQITIFRSVEWIQFITA
ncbi:MAG: hypothetical protein MR426_02415, partial [Clostridiales bacterium]|nr:hypothetical protein [Clostridiales bacterium]